MGNNHSRRDFLRAAFLAGGAVALGGSRRLLAAEDEAAGPRLAPSLAAPGLSRVGLIKGESRRTNVIEALKAIEKDVRRGLEGKKRVLIKPNFVHTSVALAATQGEAVAGILEFLRPFYKGEIVIGESAASGPTEEGFKNYGYEELVGKYGVQLVNFDKEPIRYLYVSDDKFVAKRVRVADRAFDPDTYIISAAVMKTHDRIVATLSLKNLLVGIPIKDAGFKWGAGSKGSNDKPLMHGGNTIRGINYTLFKAAQEIRPNLAVIDGWQGLQGNGPVGGFPMDTRVAVASTDFLAADRVALEVMGIDPAKVGYLSFCAMAGLGQYDLAKLDIQGEKPENVKRPYKLHDKVESQYEWGPLSV
jgi:uncharacterized protein (DUF362 family)